MAIYRFSMNHGSRAKGTSAGAHGRYIVREGRYANSSDELKYSESGNMPEWVKNGELQFWDAADLYEAENARLYTEFEIALPRELSLDQQILLIQNFVKSEIGERHPYTFALHESGSRDGGKNPHVHLMFSTRTHDDYRRSEAVFFKRANTKEPWEGGARKDRSWMPKDRLKELREIWQEAANSALEVAGSKEQIDHRTLEAQGIDREPQPKLTPFEYQLWQRGTLSPKVEQILALEEVSKLQVKQEEVEAVIGNLEKVADLRAYMLNVESFLERQQGKIGELERRRDRADAAVDKLTKRIGEYPKTSQEALVSARSSVYGRAYTEHRLEIENASERLTEAKADFLSTFDSPLETFKRFGSMFGAAKDIFERRQDLAQASSASKQFAERMQSDQVRQECEALAEELILEREKVCQERDQSLEQALRLRGLLEKYQQIAKEVSQIVANVAKDINIKQQDLPVTIQKYLAIDPISIGQEQDDTAAQITVSEKLEQSYKLEQAQRVDDD